MSKKDNYINIKHIKQLALAILLLIPCLTQAQIINRYRA